MKGQPPLELDIGAVAVEPPSLPILVYVPLDTPLLAAARDRGLKTAPTGSACCCTRRCAASNCGSGGGPR